MFETLGQKILAAKKWSSMIIFHMKMAIKRRKYIPTCRITPYGPFCVCVWVCQEIGYATIPSLNQHLVVFLVETNYITTICNSIISPWDSRHSRSAKSSRTVRTRTQRSHKMRVTFLYQELWKNRFLGVDTFDIVWSIAKCRIFGRSATQSWS